MQRSLNCILFLAEHCAYEMQWNILYLALINLNACYKI